MSFAVTPWIAPGIPQVFQSHTMTRSVLARTTGAFYERANSLRPEDSAVRM